MKFIGVLVFLLAMNWSWSLIHSPTSISQSVHLGIQEDVKQIISTYIQENLPNSQNLTFDRFWTEKLKEGKVKASFIYSFEDENAEVGAAKVQVEGFAVLNKTPEETKDYEVWSFDELHILDNQIEFKEPLKVSPGALDD